MNTWRIRIRGRVQGVGFRPFVWNAATAQGLLGQVSNGVEGVTIELNGNQAQALNFQSFITQNPPRGSLISDTSIEPVEHIQFERFTIAESQQEGVPSLLLTPDTALCGACRAEVHDPAARRFQYGFTTCTYCGPRYSLIQALPYDRANTTMHGFQMCPTCTTEYHTPSDRRFYAQTNSCPECGIALAWYGGTDTAAATVDTATAIERTMQYWTEGKTVAIKGIGGYLLTCDATNHTAIQRLRVRKNRPSKPFALLYPSLSVLAGDARLSPTITDALTDPAAPIVLLDTLSHPASGLQTDAVAPGLDQVGAMLPYAPLFELLLGHFGKPIVATSGNRSQSPIVYDTNGWEELYAVADGILTHNRPIAIPQDDSVLRYAGERPIILRRSRGLAPSMQVAFDTDGGCAVALGAEVKSSFTLNYSGRLLVSQYWGNLGDWDTQNRFSHFLEKTAALLQVQPTLILTDLHPAYFSTQYGESLSKTWQVPVHRIQHHEAHFAAVLGENNLISGNTPTLGVIWDGTGWGTDGQIWGSEFFINQNNTMTRVAHLPYFPALLGDKMSREPRISALSVFGQWPESESVLAPQFDQRAWDLYRNMRTAHHGIQTCSMGRLFDAVAALLGLAGTTSYEGEAAAYLEGCARKYCTQNGFASVPQGYFARSGSQIHQLDWLRLLLNDVLNGLPKEQIAALFHVSLIEMIEHVAQKSGLRQLAFSGGVFQNAVLVEWLQHRLGACYRLFFHHQLSPNDENISFGQWVHARFFTKK